MNDKFLIPFVNEFKAIVSDFLAKFIKYLNERSGIQTSAAESFSYVIEDIVVSPIKICDHSQLEWVIYNVVW